MLEFCLAEKLLDQFILWREWIGRSTGEQKPSEENIAGPGGEVIVDRSGVAEEAEEAD